MRMEYCIDLYAKQLIYRLVYVGFSVVEMSKDTGSVLNPLLAGLE